MNRITAEELDLLSFFEVEPTRADVDSPWPYNHLSYKVELDPYAVEFGITPSSLDLSFSISHNGSEIYSFAAVPVKDIRYHKDGDLETLEIVVNDKDCIWLRLRPTVKITQRAGDE